MNTDKWQVWEQYGYNDERLIMEFDTFDQAVALYGTYKDEVDDLHVVITKNNSTEY